ncbi:hypothetical protein D3C81_1246570 [compost metagenome]
MGGQDDGDAFLVDLAHIVPQLAAQLDVDARRRLVQDQDRRIVHQSLGHHQAALHAAGQGTDIGVGLVRQAERGQQFVRAALVGRHAIEAGLNLQRLARGEEDVGDDFLGHDAERRARVAGLVVDVAVPDADRALGLVHHPGDDVDQGRLARAVGAQQPEHGAARHGQIDAAQGRLGRRLLVARIGLLQAPHLDGVDRQGRGLGHAGVHSEGGSVRHR